MMVREAVEHLAGEPIRVGGWLLSLRASRLSPLFCWHFSWS